MRRIILGGIIGLVILYVLILNQSTGSFHQPIYDYLIEHSIQETGSDNMVTGIYLNYRVYDTLFEALLLIVSVIGVIYLSIHEEHYHD